MKAEEAFKQTYKIFLENKISSASLDAEVLLLEAINRKVKKAKDKVWLYVHYKNYELNPEMESILKDFIRRRKNGEPVAYIMGKKEFYGLDFFVNQNVLIPRNETELIIDQALEIIEKSDSEFALLDVGTGTGCIPISILKQTRAANKIKRAYANDISQEALDIAKRNARYNGVYQKIKFIKSDLTKAIAMVSKEENVIITANLPYISENKYQKLEKSVKNFEPKIALTAPDKGLFQIKKMIDSIANERNGLGNYLILIEADPAQMRTLESFASKRMEGCQVLVLRDLRGKKRIMKISSK